jgi:hypothetical protein
LIFGEIVALLAVLGASGFGISALVAYAKKADAEQARREAHEVKRQQELRDALKSRDYRKLDDYMLLYAKELSSDEKKHIQIRRDELYVEANP